RAVSQLPGLLLLYINKNKGGVKIVQTRPLSDKSCYSRTLRQSDRTISHLCPHQNQNRKRMWHWPSRACYQVTHSLPMPEASAGQHQNQGHIIQLQQALYWCSAAMTGEAWPRK